MWWRPVVLMSVRSAAFCCISASRPAVAGLGATHTHLHTPTPIQSVAPFLFCQDLVFGCFEGTIRYYQRSGNKYTERTGEDNPFGAIDVGASSHAAFVHDMNGDSMPELVVGNQLGVLSFFVTNFCRRDCSGQGICRAATDVFVRQKCHCSRTHSIVDCVPKCRFIRQA